MGKIILSSKTFLTYTLGCRVNQAEISAISSQLSAISMEIFGKAKHAFPDIVLINTCAVTQKAERESRKAIHHFKRIYPKAKVISLGCAAKFIKDADLVIENIDKENSLKIIFRRFPDLNTPRRSPFGKLRATIRGEMLIKNPQLLITNYQLLSASGRALVKIQEGCNQFCAYCIVPYLRGKPKSTPVKEIICQINHLVQNGIKEIILCGINLSLYGIDSSSSPQNDKQRMPQNDTSSHPERSEGSCSNLTFLLKQILKKTKAERISLSSIEPEYLYENREFVELFLKERRFSKYFHLALQSGSSDNLKNMGRKTDLKKLLKTLRFIKEKYPEFTFRADIIAGFPTETEKNSQETLDFIKSTRISFVHSFQFSTRPGTKTEGFIKSGKWRDLPPATKKERSKRLMELTKNIQKKEAKKLIGKILSCLIIRKVSGGYEAMAGNSWTVRISHQPALLASRRSGRRGRSSAIGSQTLIGKILPIKIIGFENNYLLAAGF